MTEFDVHLRRGTIRTRRFGPADGKAILCVPGLPGNSRTFDFIGEQLGMGERQVVSFDLRGRGFSPPTGPGTYGWRNEARDVLDLATALEIDTFDLAGHSAGAFVAMQVAVLMPSRVRRLILIDGLGRPQLTAFWEVMRTVQRLGRVYPSAEEYLAEVRGLGVIDPWNDHWERYFRYELKPTAGGVRSRASLPAVWEDTLYGMGHDPRRSWSRVRTPTLLVHASRPLVRPHGVFVTERDIDQAARALPAFSAVAVDANHYGVVMHRETAETIRQFIA
jgi:pimeloyl-ACP methyl ester carboxylesterase